MIQPTRSHYHNHKRTPCDGAPPIFRSDLDACVWAVEQGAYAAIPDAQRALAELRQSRFQATWACWLGDVAKILTPQRQKDAKRTGRP